MVVIWHGSQDQLVDLTKILAGVCVCDFEAGHNYVCPPHKAFQSDQRFMDGLLYGRAMRRRFLVEEGLATLLYREVA